MICPVSLLFLRNGCSVELRALLQKVHRVQSTDAGALRFVGKTDALVNDQTVDLLQLVVNMRLTAILRHSSCEMLCSAWLHWLQPTIFRAPGSFDKIFRTTPMLNKSLLVVGITKIIPA